MNEINAYEECDNISIIDINCDESSDYGSTLPGSIPDDSDFYRGLSNCYESDIDIPSTRPVSPNPDVWGSLELDSIGVDHSMRMEFAPISCNIAFPPPPKLRRQPTSGASTPRVRSRSIIPKLWSSQDDYALSQL